MGFILFEGRDSGFFSKMGAGFGIESMHWKDAECRRKPPTTNEIEPKFESGGMTGLKNPVREPLVFAF